MVEPIVGENYEAHDFGVRPCGYGPRSKRFGWLVLRALDPTKGISIITCDPKIMATRLTRKGTAITPTPAEKNVLTVLESCFKIVPGMEAELVELQRRFWPVATSQPGFVSVQIGTIVNST